MRGRGGGESVDAEAAAPVVRRPDLHRQVAGCLTNRKSERSIPRDSGVRGSFPHEASDLPNAHMTHIQAGGRTEGVLQPSSTRFLGYNEVQQNNDKHNIFLAVYKPPGLLVLSYSTFESLP